MNNLLCRLCFITLLGIGCAEAQSYQIVHTFEGVEGAFGAQLLLGQQGILYGAAGGGGTFQGGTFFELQPNKQLTVLYNFSPSSGTGPGGLISIGGGVFDGITTFGGAFNNGTVFQLNTNGREKVLHSFVGNHGDGANPEGVLVRDDAGNIYGTALYGGLAGCGNGLGCGTVYKLTKHDAVTQLHTFTGGKDGGWPASGLVRDKAGNFYGTTTGGGDLSCFQGYGCGTIFKITAGGKFAVVHTFRGKPGDGSAPYSPLILDDTGNVYGTTSRGGTADLGTIFKLSSQGRLTVLYSFLGSPADGALPYAMLTRDKAGNLYGETTSGGNNGQNCVYYPAGPCGTVFVLNTKGKERVLHYFTGLKGDGFDPGGGLTIDQHGELYGTTGFGGDLNCAPLNFGCGVIFKLKP